MLTNNSSMINGRRRRLTGPPARDQSMTAATTSVITVAAATAIGTLPEFHLKMEVDSLETAISSQQHHHNLRSKHDNFPQPSFTSERRQQQAAAAPASASNLMDFTVYGDVDDNNSNPPAGSKPPTFLVNHHFPLEPTKVLPAAAAANGGLDDNNSSIAATVKSKQRAARMQSHVKAVLSVQNVNTPPPEKRKLSSVIAAAANEKYAVVSALEQRNEAYAAVATSYGKTTPPHPKSNASASANVTAKKLRTTAYLAAATAAAASLAASAAVPTVHHSTTTIAVMQQPLMAMVPPLQPTPANNCSDMNGRGLVAGLVSPLSAINVSSTSTSTSSSSFLSSSIESSTSNSSMLAGRSANTTAVLVQQRDQTQHNYFTLRQQGLLNSSSSSSSSQQPNWRLDDFEVGRKLGKGTFGEVYLARHQSTSYVLALKVIGKKKVKQYDNAEQVQRELEFQSHLRHANILHCFGFFYDSRRIFIMLEYAANGELYKLLKHRGRFSDPESATYVCELASALDYCHTNGVMHRDIKPENLLLGYLGELKLADFGWCARFSAAADRRNTFCGTLEYLSPEMIEGVSHSYEVDVWSVGVFAYEMLTGTAPFQGESEAELKEKILALQYTFPSYVADDARDLIRKLLCRTPSERIRLSKIEQHPWCKRYRMRREDGGARCKPHNVPTEADFAVQYFRTKQDPASNNAAAASSATTTVIVTNNVVLGGGAAVAVVATVNNTTHH